MKCVVVRLKAGPERVHSRANCWSVTEDGQLLVLHPRKGNLDRLVAVYAPGAWDSACVEPYTPAVPA